MGIRNSVDDTAMLSMKTGLGSDNNSNNKTSIEIPN